MAHTFTSLMAHIIFSTKNRLPTIDDELRPRLHAYTGGIIHELKGRPLKINGTSDHVHILLWLPATLAVSDAMRVVKTNSSRWVHQEWSSRKEFGWQTGFAAFSVSQSVLAPTERYIAAQEEHHRKFSFQEELILYLKKHGIEYDERYIWE